MQREIERKFLLTNDWKDRIKKYAVDKNLIRQGYLKLSDPVVRVRTFNNIGKLTIKGNPTDGELGVDEYEYTIPYVDAINMLLTLCDRELWKTRYSVFICGKIWEIDEFLGDNKGLIFCEVELDSEDEFLDLPNFIGKEVTGNERFYNNWIINNPIGETNEND